jgi:uncharacterized protein (DUF1330 family)
MEINNKVSPSKEQIEGFFEPGPDGPIFMLNMLKFKEKAEYEDGRITDLTGAQAYALYGAAVSKILISHGGGSMFNAKVERLMIGEVEDLWDSVAIAMYPSRQAMITMLQSEDYQAIHVHRDAGLAGQLNIETTNPGGIWVDVSGIDVAE